MMGKLREGLFGKSRLENVTFIYLNLSFVCVCVLKGPSIKIYEPENGKVNDYFFIGKSI